MFLFIIDKHGRHIGAVVFRRKFCEVRDLRQGETGQELLNGYVVLQYAVIDGNPIQIGSNMVDLPGIFRKRKTCDFKPIIVVNVMPIPIDPFHSGITFREGNFNIIMVVPVV